MAIVGCDVCDTCSKLVNRNIIFEFGAQDIGEKKLV